MWPIEKPGQQIIQSEDEHIHRQRFLIYIVRLQNAKRIRRETVQELWPNWESNSTMDLAKSIAHKDGVDHQPGSTMDSMNTGPNSSMDITQ